MKTLLVQHATGTVHQALLESTCRWHQSLCNSAGWKYAYDSVGYFPQAKVHPYWEKVFELGYHCAAATFDRIIWIDADAVMRRAEFPEFNTPFAMTWHEPPDDHHHFNAGVIYINNTPESRGWINEWLQTPDDGHKWHDQWALNKLLFAHPEIVTRLDHRWNSVEHIPQYQAPDPVVKAWHGLGGNCLTQLQTAVEEAFHAHV